MLIQPCSDDLLTEFVVDIFKNAWYSSGTSNEEVRRRVRRED